MKIFFRSTYIGIYTGYGSSNNTLKNIDSGVYVYSGHRGGDLDSGTKPDAITYYAWDTAALVWLLDSRELISYDAVDRDTLEVIQKLIAGIWTGVRQNHYQYDGAGNLTMWQQDTFSTAAGSFVPYRQTLSTFNSANKILSSAQYNWSSTAALFSEPLSRYTYTYDAANNLLSYQSEIGSNSIFMLRYRTSSTYDASNHLLTQLNENYTGGAWAPTNRATRTYNAAGKLLTSVDEVFSGGTWMYTSRMLSTYDADGNEITRTGDSWNTATSSWTRYNRYAYYYNSANHNIATVYQNTGVSSAPIFDSTTYTYDAAGNCTQKVEYYHSPAAGWILVYRYSFTYTSANRKSTELRERYTTASIWQNVYRYAAFYNSRNQIVRKYEQDWINGAWAYDPFASEYRYYYESYNNGVGVASVPGINQDDMLLYPIPAHDKMELMLNLSKPQSFTATIVDAAGRVVMRWDDSGSGLYTHSIATTPLANGVYYLDIRGAGSVAVRSFVVQH